MRIVLTTVLEAKVEINNKTVGQISRGYLLLVGFTQGDNEETVMKMVDSLSKSEGREEGGVRWNFTKFLISKDGSIIKRFPPVAKPEDMEADIETMLK